MSKGNWNKFKYDKITYFQKTCLKTWHRSNSLKDKDNLKYIENSFKYDINNGIIEGTNNLIKCLKELLLAIENLIIS